MTKQEVRELIIANTKDLVSDLCYYDRKEDEELSREVFNKAIEDKTITIDEIIYFFSEELKSKME